MLLLLLGLGTLLVVLNMSAKPEGIESKTGVIWAGATPKLLAGIQSAKAAVDAAGLGPFVVTSVLDGKHMDGSLHYVGRAADIRTRHLPADRQALMHQAIKGALGIGWDVLLESDHIHMEWDPK